MTTNRVLAVLSGVLALVLVVGAWFVLGPGAGSDDTAGATAPSPSSGATSSPSSSPVPTREVDPSPSPTGGSPTPTAPEEPSASAVGPGPAAYVVASTEGVVRRVDGTDTSVSDGPARVGHGIDDLVVYELEGSRGASGEVRVWSPRDDRPLALAEDADASSLLGVGAVDGSPVALVGEEVPGSTATEVTDRLVAVDLLDGSRTVFADGRTSFESGWAAATVLPGGDVVATRQSQVVLELVRLTPDAEERWSVRVAEDRPADLAVVGDRPSVVLPGVAEEQGTSLRVDTYALDGSRTTRTRVDLDEQVPGQVACADWFSTDRLVCRTGESPRLVTVRGDDAGAVDEIPGAAGAVVTAVATSG